MNDNPKKVFTDASSAILLYKADLFSSFADAWQVVMAPSVFSEITEPGYPGSVYFKSLGKKTAKIIRQEPSSLSHPLSGLKNFAAMDQGEKDTIQLFCDSTGFGSSEYGLSGPGQNASDKRIRDFKKTGAFVLMDDGKAARFCHAQQIPFINALLIPKIFWYSGRMDQKKYLEKTALLSDLGRYAKKVLATANNFSQADLTYFIGGNFHG